MADIKVKGNLNKTYRFLNNKLNLHVISLLNYYGEIGVDALSKATPIRSGVTAASWYYDIEYTQYGAKLSFNNMNVQQGWANIAILIQNGHATRNGGWVEGIDYINPAIRPVFEEMADKLFKEVSKK